MTDGPRDDTAYRILRIIHDAGDAGCDLYRFVDAYWPPGSRQRTKFSPGQQRSGASGVLQVLVRAGELHKVTAGPQSRFALYRLTPLGRARFERLHAAQLADAENAQPHGEPSVPSRIAVRRKPRSEPPEQDPTNPDDWSR